jgi:hypothetical protein
VFVCFQLYQGGGTISEIRSPELSIPLANYVQLIRNRKSPYYDIVDYLLKDMEMHYGSAGKDSEIVYTINPRILQGEIEGRVRNEKLTTVNVCRTILALLYGSKLREEKDFYFTTTSSGRRNYHVRVNAQTLRSIASF